MGITPKGKRQMGHVLLPTGQSVWIEDLNGSINLSQLINDVRCNDYTSSYRVSVISALAKLKKNGKEALSSLKELIRDKDRLIADAATHAVKKIEESLDKRGYKEEDWYGTSRSHTTNAHTSSFPQTYNSHHTTVKKPEINKVTITHVGDDLASDDLKTYCQCNFCEKLTLCTKQLRWYSNKLGGQEKFFCHFCIRNDYYTKFNSNVFMLTFRGIIGYYYYSYYIVPKSSSMYLIDIQDYVDLHCRVGLQNPLFRYDPDTFCWFVDFSKIGNGKRKISVDCVLETVVEVLASFNLYENVRDCSPWKLYDKYKTAILGFHENRIRPNNEMVFAPTLVECDIPITCQTGQKAIPVDVLSGFIPSHLTDNNQFNRAGKRF